ncbi:MAG: hypothetical protein HRT99_00560 [Mycoplasmatales bacterium]|nr:hypothetical protein [Mycoplasmatales bacterium]
MFLIILITINSIFSALSIDKINDFLQKNNYTGNKIDEGERHYRMIVIIKTIINEIVILFFVGYVYFAYVKIKVGYIFCVFWSFIWIGNILSSWLLPGTYLWFSIIVTFLSISTIIFLFYHFVILNQINFYNSRFHKWGGK